MVSDSIACADGKFPREQSFTSENLWLNNFFVVATETLHYENAWFAQQLFNHEPRHFSAVGAASL